MIGYFSGQFFYINLVPGGFDYLLSPVDGDFLVSPVDGQYLLGVV